MERQADMTQVNKKILHTVLEQTAEQFAGNTAVEHGDQQISHRELHTAADRMALQLQAGGAGQNTIIALYLENSMEFVTAILGVMKAGAVFMPLDISHPAKRIEMILRKTRPAFMLAGRDTRAALETLAAEFQEYVPSWHYGCIQADLALNLSPTGPDFPENPVLPEGAVKPRCISEPDDANYIFFTSGSTGEPKGVLGCHKALSHFIHWESGEFNFDSDTRITQLAPVSFDACLKDIFVPMLRGGTVCIPEKGVRNNISLLVDWINHQRITVVHCVPSMLRALMSEIESREIQPGFLRHLKHVIVAGDAIFGKDVTKWMELFKNRTGAPPVELVNLYGPTETTLIKTCHRIREIPVSPGTMVHVGHPISNTAILIIKGNRLCDIGEIGDIYIKTPFMAKGYYNDPGATRAAFIPNPIQSDSGEIVYRTGDLGRYLPDRSIEFVGRLDNQVKINGIRMDLSEIEQALIPMPALEEAVVQPHRNPQNENHLVCYYVEKQQITPAEIRDYLGERLPPYMLPAHYVPMAEMPLNLNGKIDRKALPKPEELLYIDKKIVPPESEVEEKLVAIWQDVLGIRKVSVESPFFEIGGHSLKAIQMVSRIYKAFNTEIRLKDFFDHPTIRQQAILLTRPDASGPLPILPAPLHPHYELSHAQKRLWILSGMDTDGISYSMPGVYLARGPLQKELLQRGFETLISRHESLRTTFPVIDGDPRQKIHPDSPEIFHIREIRLHDLLSGNSSPADMETAHAIAPHVAEDIARPFDLVRGNLVRLTLIKLHGDLHVLIFNMHHIIGDAWSVDVIARELFALYAGYGENRPVSLPELTIQYKDFTLWQNGLIGTPKGKRDADYWLTKLGGRLPVLNLPLDHPRPPVPRYMGKTEYFEWDTRLLKRIADFSNAQKATLFMTLMTGVKILLHRYSDQSDCIVGTPMAGRDHPALENQVGFYVNTLAIRDEVNPEETFTALLTKVRQSILEAYEHQLYPFDLLVNELDMPRDTGRAPVFDVMVVFQGGAEPELTMGDIVFTEMDIETGTSKFDLTLIFKEMDGKLKIGFNYNTDIFNGDTIRRMEGHLRNIFHRGLSAPDTAITDINLLTAAEQQQLTTDFRGDSCPFPEDQSLVDLFNTHAKRFKDHTAVIFEERRLTYAELNRQADALARCLVGRFKIMPGDLVGMMMDRSDDSIICLLAILKSGGMCLPLDPLYPCERILHMLQNCKCAMVIIDSPDMHRKCIPDDGLETYRFREFAQLMSMADSPSLADIELPRVFPGEPAFLFYTSGSTGTPKGVFLEHLGYVNMVMGLIQIFEITPSDNILQCVSYSFDVSMSEIFITLLSGATLVVANRERLDNPRAFMDYLNFNAVSLAMLSPTYLSALDPREMKNLRVLITGGEPPEPEDAAYYSRMLNYYNAYGPTEASVYATLCRFEPERHYPLGIPIGKPIPNTAIHIVDKKNRLVPMGVSGEICIAGTGLARKYLNQKEMTAEKFIQNPFGEGRLYRTGDLGKWLPDGNILFMGRRDEQIKIRGHRVELGEIETRLGKYPGIKRAVVIKIKALHQLAAYIVTDADPEPGELRAQLSRFLPDYMIPSFFIRVGKLPLTPTGKIDREALPVPDETKQNTFQPVPPRNLLEEKILGIFKEILNRKDMGVFENFFDLGGTSLGAIKLAAAIFNALNINVSARQVFLTPTVASFVPALAEKPDKTQHRVLKNVCMETDHTRLVPRPLTERIADKTVQAIDSAALEYLPDDLLSEGLEKDAVLGGWCDSTPVLNGIMETAQGRIGLITLPLFTSDLFRDEKETTRAILAALKLAGTMGARAVSMTGLLPYATRQGLSITECIPSAGNLPALTTGLASVTAVMTMNVEKLLAESCRNMAEEHMGIIGCDIQEQILLKTMLEVLPHPRAITLCGVYRDVVILKRLARKITSDCGFNGRIRILSARPAAPPEFYDASLIAGSGNVTGVVDIRALRPGSLLVSDPARPCFHPESAFNRLESQNDILFTQGDLLATTIPWRKQLHLNGKVLAELPPDALNRLFQKDPNTITGCVLSGLLSACDPPLPATIGDIESGVCFTHISGIRQLGFEAAAPEYGGRKLRNPLKEKFREDFRTVNN